MLPAPISTSSVTSAVHPALCVSTPGRVCLFGEHQDYLQLPVIPCAISLRIAIEGKYRSDRTVKINLPDIASAESFSLEGPLHYTVERDYFRSVVNVVRRAGMTFSCGFDCTVRGRIPINAGTSSSSALIVTWVNFLARMSDQHKELPPGEIARLAHAAEVLEFNEPGGMMDHYSTAFGGVIAIDFYPHIAIERLDAPLKTIVLGDSREPKDTKGILARVKNQVLDATKKLSTHHPEFSLHTVTREDLDRYRMEISESQLSLLRGTIQNRDITRLAKSMLRERPLDHRQIGRLLSEHQAILRDVLQISTPKIDGMIDAALNAGAYGGKINGSGGGGCMFVYAPEHPENVALAIKEAGGSAYILDPDTGTRLEMTELAG